MQIRTDLALELKEDIKEDVEGIICKEKKEEQTTITSIEVKTTEAANKILKPCGKYITVEVPQLTASFTCTDKRIKIVANEIKKLIPSKGLVLVVGLGNSNITPDALGPKSAQKILATRHILNNDSHSLGLNSLRKVAVFVPGVLGQTGVESSELILSVTKKLNPCAVILIDALASRDLKRLGRTIQISNTGISPGSGVGNKRPDISKNTIGVPVISIGVPTVVDAFTLSCDVMANSDEKNINIEPKMLADCKKMMVTPREIDLLIQRAGLLVSMAVNCALHPSFSAEDLFSLVG